MRLFNMFKKDETGDEKKRSDVDHNAILVLLMSKHVGQWTKGVDIENHFKESIAGYTVGVCLNNLLTKKFVDYSRNMDEYKINVEGRNFMNAGGFK